MALSWFLEMFSFKAQSFETHVETLPELHTQHARCVWPALQTDFFYCIRTRLSQHSLCWLKKLACFHMWLLLCTDPYQFTDNGLWNPFSLSVIKGSWVVNFVLRFGIPHWQDRLSRTIEVNLLSVKACFTWGRIFLKIHFDLFKG